MAGFVRRTIPAVMAVKVLIMLMVIVYAASITISTKNYNGEKGGQLNVTNGLLVTDKGFTSATSGSPGVGTSCSSPVTFSSTPKTANTTITTGHLVFDVQVNSTTSALANTDFNVTLVLASITYGPLCVQTPASPQNGQTIDCKFDVGTSLPASPYSFKVTVQ